MRVAMYYNNQDVRVEEMPVPQIGPGELLVRVRASGICGSDVMEWYRVARAPMVLGHEVAGEVVQVGEGVDRFKEGDAVRLDEVGGLHDTMRRQVFVQQVSALEEGSVSKRDAIELKQIEYLVHDG